MFKRVFITGGSGFVGSAVLRELGKRGISGKALVNNSPLSQAPAGIESVTGSLFDPDTLESAMAGCDAVIHLVGIIFEKPSKGITFERVHFTGTQNIVDAARKAGIRRYIQMSALGTRADAVSDYHKTKFRAEQYVRASGLDWTILRPSMIHGPGGEFMNMEARWARGTAPPFLFMPYFGSGLFGGRGAGTLQPVFVEDVARAFVDALEKPQTIKMTYSLCGTDVLTWPQLHRTASRLIVGKPRRAIPIPVWVANLYVALGIAKLAGFNRDQVVMSQENNAADMSEFVRDFDFTPRGFEASLGGYAAAL